MDFLEREPVLQALGAALRDAAAGHGRVALISGEAGIGKTTLVGALRRDAAAGGSRARGARATRSFTPRPLGPLHDIAGRLPGPLHALLDGDAPPDRDLLAASSTRCGHERAADGRRRRGRALGRHAHHYMLAWQGLMRTYQGRWPEAGEAARAVTEAPDVSIVARIMALVALGRLRTRRGDPGAAAALDEALELAAQTGTLQRLAPVRAARAEAAWLDWRSGARRAWRLRAVYDLAVPPSTPPGIPPSCRSGGWQRR